MAEGKLTIGDEAYPSTGTTIRMPQDPQVNQYSTDAEMYRLAYCLTRAHGATTDWGEPVVITFANGVRFEWRLSI